MRAALTKRQKEVLDAIREMTVEDVAPTYDELAARLGMRSKGNLAAHLASLREKGRIAFTPQARSIRIIEDDQPLESEIASATTDRLRAVIEDAADAPAGQIGRPAAANLLARLAANQRLRARKEAAGRERGKPHRFSRQKP